MLYAAVACFIVKTPSLQLAVESAIAAVELRLLQGAHALAWWSAVAMLASSCCALQLILSAASLGCSGLNSILGPLRPPMIAATVLLQCAAWWVVLHKRPQQAASVAMGSFLAMTLTFLPELLHIKDTRDRHRKHARSTDDSTSVIQFQLARVGCSACGAKVRAITEACKGVVSCEVDIDTAIATIRISSQADASRLRPQLSTLLASGGYSQLEPEAGTSSLASCPTGYTSGSRETDPVHEKAA